MHNDLSLISDLVILSTGYKNTQLGGTSELEHKETDKLTEPIRRELHLELQINRPRRFA